ncbi:MAG: 5-formyltetrahydrofolate cyclo-ligase [Cyclobacteriaceae bacterium]
MRKTLLGYRRVLSEEFFRKRNEKLCEKILDVVRTNDSKTVHVFLSIARNREPDVSPLFQELRSLGCQIVAAKTNFGSKKQQHFYMNEDTVLQQNKMNIPEPVGAEPADIKAVDLILVPLSAADKKGNRIGYGGGYYDRLLKSSNALKVGLCLSPVLDEISQTEEWDVRLDQIITPF